MTMTLVSCGAPVAGAPRLAARDLAALAQARATQNSVPWDPASVTQPAPSAFR